MNPLDWSATPFLRFYLLASLIVALTIFFLRRVLKGRADPLAASELNLLEMAYLSGGAQRMTDTIMVGLMVAGGATYDATHRLFSLHPSEARLPKELETICAKLGGSGTRKGIADTLRQASEDIRDRLVRRRFVLPAVRQNLVTGISLGAVAFLILLGAAKIAVGTSRHRPTGFLEILIFMLLIAGMILLRNPPRATAAGEKALSDNRLRHERLARAPLDSEMALAFAITGAAVLVGTPFAAFGQTLRSDGSSGGCGGGGGGGGCGGGCGGCS